MGVSGQHHAPAARFTPGTHCAGGWVGSRDGLEAKARGKKSSVSVGDRTPVVQSAVRHKIDWATSAPKHLWNVGHFLRDYTAQHPTRQSSSEPSVKTTNIYSRDWPSEETCELKGPLERLSVKGNNRGLVPPSDETRELNDFFERLSVKGNNQGFVPPNDETRELNDSFERLSVKGNNRGLVRPSDETRELNNSFERLCERLFYWSDLDELPRDSELVGPIITAQ
jgi:hypothetical protein